MISYIVKRLLQGFLLINAVLILVFLMLYLMPGDPISHIVDIKVPEAKRQELRVKYGFDKPLPVQYIRWLKLIVVDHDLGNSYKSKQPVWTMLKPRMAVSGKLVGMIWGIQLVIAVPLGLLCAYRRNSLLDRSIVNVSLLLSAVPEFWLAVLFILFFSIRLHWLPISGSETPLHYVLPVAVGVCGGLTATIRLLKSEAIDVFREKYVLTAYAKGLKKPAVIVRHVLRNALITITVLVFMSIPWLVAGTVIIENIFAIPGMGKLMVTSIIQQDFPVVQAIMLIVSSLTVIFNILCDIILGLLDPRIRISLTGGGSI